ncbi:MAG: SIR2 family protein [Pirellulales bacterium]|nr:SIR2 family protein [Pirellulales bacterium]
MSEALQLGPDFVMDDGRPFTMLFDDATLRAHDTHDRTCVKSVIAAQLRDLRPNLFHRRLLDLDVRHILTTNYDYALEQASDDRPRDISHHAKKYSLFRRRVVAKMSIWHIHGEINTPRSLVLGYDQYMGQVQRMRLFLKGFYHGKKSPFTSGIREFESGKSLYSWCDVFLRDDVHILGLGLSYSELDLWWMLYYKARLKRRGVNVGRTVFYNIRTEPAVTPELKSIRTLDVEVVEVDAQSGYDAAWESLLQQLRTAI